MLKQKFQNPMWRKKFGRNINTNTEKAFACGVSTFNRLEQRQREQYHV